MVLRKSWHLPNSNVQSREKTGAENLVRTVWGSDSKLDPFFRFELTLITLNDIKLILKISNFLFLKIPWTYYSSSQKVMHRKL